MSEEGFQVTLEDYESGEDVSLANFTRRIMAARSCLLDTNQ